MENTLENKEAFFCLYWGQEVLNWDDKITNGLSRVEAISEISEGEALDFYFLELTPLAQISDEDAIEIQKLNLWADYREGQGDKQEYIDHAKSFIRERNNMLQIYSDYLRSKGYALPFRGVDVETLISWGWVKLKTEKE